MSVKFPVIPKKQALSTQLNASSIEQNSSNIYEQQFEVDYHPEEDITDEKVEPIQTLISLKKEKQNQNNDFNFEKPESSSKNEIEQMRKKLDEKTNIITELKLSIADKKKQIKDISEQVDRDLNKTLLKASKTSNHVNIRDIFSVNVKKQTGKIGQFNEELGRIRTQIKRVKVEVAKVAALISDPLNVMNNEKGNQSEAKIKQIDAEISKKQEQKQILIGQVERTQKDVGEDDNFRQAQIQKLKGVLAEINTEIRQQKSNIYHIEREDILLMEKAKFIQERQVLLGNKKTRPNIQRSRVELEQQIKQYVNSINKIIEQRNKAEFQRKNSYRSLTAEVSASESKNWDICNRLREIDAYLLQYYQKKSRKKQVGKNDKHEKSAVLKLDTIELPQKTPKSQKVKQVPQAKQTTRINDKNLQSMGNTETVLVEKKKNYEFSFTQKQTDGQIMLSDQFLGNKCFLTKISITHNANHVVSLSSSYLNFAKVKINGLKMGAKDQLSQIQSTQLKLSHQNLQVINLIHIGYYESGAVCYLQIVTSQGNSLQWGNLQKSVKNEQKNIRRYEYAVMKAKLLPFENSFCLSGLIFSTIYLGPK